MYTAASYIQHHPSFLSSTRNYPYFHDTIPLPSGKSLTSDNEDDNQSLSSSITGDMINGIPLKKRSRTVPSEEKDAVYYEKRTRNNESAKRSRDTRRIKEEQIQDRVNFLEHENARLVMENQAIRYQLHTLYNGTPKPSQ